MSTLGVQTDAEVKSGAWFKGVSAANAIVLAHDEAYDLSVSDVSRMIGIYVCEDGLCQGVCSRSFDRVREKHMLRYGESWDFVDGANFALAGISSFLRSENE